MELGNRNCSLNRTECSTSSHLNHLNHFNHLNPPERGGDRRTITTKHRWGSFCRGHRTRVEKFGDQNETLNLIWRPAWPMCMIIFHFSLTFHLVVHAKIKHTFHLSFSLSRAFAYGKTRPSFNTPCWGILWFWPQWLGLLLKSAYRFVA